MKTFENCKFGEILTNANVESLKTKDLHATLKTIHLVSEQADETDVVLVVGI